MTERYVSAIDTINFDDEFVKNNPELEVRLEFQAIRALIKKMEKALAELNDSPDASARTQHVQMILHMTELLSTVRREMEARGVSVFGGQEMVLVQPLAQDDFLDEYSDFEPQPKRQTSAEEEAFFAEFSQHIAPIPRKKSDYIDNPLAWQEDAACLYVDPEMFFPEKGGVGIAPAKKICEGCEVKGLCLEYALENDIRFGVWGGASVTTRRRILEKREADERARIEAEKKEVRNRRIVQVLARKAGQTAV